MRPTIDEQLGGATRLLRLAEDDPETTPAVAELVRNARRLVERVSGSWSVALGFLEADSDELAALLGRRPDVGGGGDRALGAAAARNEELRAALCRRLAELPAGPERAAVGTYLRRRVESDPT